MKVEGVVKENIVATLLQALGYEVNQDYEEWREEMEDEDAEQ